jgi:hypothetical protein
VCQKGDVLCLKVEWREFSSAHDIGYEFIKRKSSLTHRNFHGRQHTLRWQHTQSCYSVHGAPDRIYISAWQTNANGITPTEPKSEVLANEGVLTVSGTGILCSKCSVFETGYVDRSNQLGDRLYRCVSSFFRRFSIDDNTSV